MNKSHPTTAHFTAAVTTVGLLLATSAPAQGVTSPPGHLTTEGQGWQGIASPGYSYLFGAYPDMHLQMMEGELKATGARTIQSIGFRLDGRVYSTADATGRSWSNVSLKLADGELAAMGATFSTNMQSTPTTVFSGSVTWPSVTGGPGSAAFNWTNPHQFGFQAGYVYSATKDLLLDWQFSGGTLANSASWTATQARFYTLDGIYLRTAAAFGPYVHKTNGNCTDSGITTPNAYANAVGQIILYAPIFENPTYADKVAFSAYSHYTAPNAPVIQAVGLNGTVPGVAIGAQCNNLMLDISGPTVYLAGTANNAGHHYTSSTILGDRSTFAPLGNTVNVWSQAAWSDSANGAFSLTAATRTNPDFGYALNTTTPKRKVLYQYDAVSASGAAPSSSSWYFLPITRYQ